MRGLFDAWRKQMKMQEEMERLVAALDEIGVEYHWHEGGMVTFANGVGDCNVFPVADV